ncbi:MAG: flagellar basal body-associated FliL family protein [Peptococcaceae bacterium]|jgi:flagellar FliL protein|nr:flagellar basal body-associated FliL family protein [Peptococcaceae bacterium]
MKKIIMIPVLVIVVIAAVVVGAILIGPKIMGTSAVELPVHKNGPVVPIGDFTINLKGGSFLKATISLEGVDEKSAGILAEKEVFLKDRVITVLSGKAVTDVATPEAKEVLRQELLVQLNDVCNHNIQQVLFTTYLYQ